VGNRDMLTPPIEGLVTRRKPKVVFLFPAPSPITYGFRFGWADSCPNTEVYR